jgi:hypothetical protein
VTEQEPLWGSLLFVGLMWTLASAVAATESVKLGMRRRAWGWTATFVVSSLVAAYSFWRWV